MRIRETAICEKIADVLSNSHYRYQVDQENQQVIAQQEEQLLKNQITAFLTSNQFPNQAAL